MLPKWYNGSKNLFAFSGVVIFLDILSKNHTIKGVVGGGVVVNLKSHTKCCVHRVIIGVGKVHLL